LDINAYFSGGGLRGWCDWSEGRPCQHVAGGDRPIHVGGTKTAKQGITYILNCRLWRKSLAAIRLISCITGG